jgi:hypothetical protein
MADVKRNGKGGSSKIQMQKQIPFGDDNQKNNCKNAGDGEGDGLGG